MDKDKRDVAEKLATADLETVMVNPKEFGCPTFQEFASNPDKWRRPTNELMGAIAGSSQALKRLKEHRYYFEGIPCKSLEDAERIAREEGVHASELPADCVQVGLEKISGGQFRAHVNIHRPGWTSGEKGFHESVDQPAQ